MRKYLLTLRLGIRTQLAYRANLLAGFVLYAFFLTVFYFLWRAIYSGGGVEGLTFTQMVWYLCITEMVSCGANARIDADVSREIKTGGIAYQLLRPYDYVVYQLTNALGGMLVTFLSYALLALVVGFVFVGPIEGYRVEFLPLCALSLLLGILLNLLIDLSIGLLAFRFEEVSGVRLIYGKLVFMLGTFIPVEFLPAWLREIALRLPFSYVTWGPARLFVGFDWKLFASVLPAQLIYIAAFGLLCALLYRNGLKKIAANGG